MSSTAHRDLAAAMTALWATGPIEDDLYRNPAFRRLRETCEALFPASGSASTFDYALARALRALGCPATDPVPGHTPMSPEEATERLTLAFTQTHIERIHLVPLDMADHFPRIAFGPAEAGHFSADDLQALLEGPGGPRGRPSGLDARHLSQFQWLVVRETSSASRPGIGGRALPELFLNFNEDFGRIIPHAKSRPEAVEAALFALLLLPWEDHDTEYNPEYRVFRIPWIHTVERDLFGSPAFRPEVSALTEFDQTFHDDDGCPVTVLRPYVIHLDPTIEEVVPRLDQQAWSDLQAALADPLFAGPVAHFFVRAFFSDPIDEFMAHVMTLEAALGSAEDYDSKTRRRFSKRDNPGAKVRVAARITALLSDPAAGEAYEALFEIRSQYVHGRVMGDIPSTARHQARVLARRCVTALINRALGPNRASRSEHLDTLLCAGIGPLRAHHQATQKKDPRAGGADGAAPD